MQGDVSHQRKIRDLEAEREPREQDSGVIGYTIESIEAEEAAAFITRYEYLGTVGHPAARYCARNEFGEVAAVAMLSHPPNVQSAGICRALNPRNLSCEDNACLATVVCYQRGACAHWAHEHTASWFIPRVLAMASRDHGWKIFYAYADPEAGEIGTIYQACGWLYIGQGPGRRIIRGEARSRLKFRHYDWAADKWVTDRAFYRRGLSMAVDVGRINGRGIRSVRRPWEARETKAKGKYVMFTGDRRERRELLRALRYPVLPYPKRPLGPSDAAGNEFGSAAWQLKMMEDLGDLY
jgi:hypothetical protein